jgi:phage repressor protein C with HTH and peptisase S24 domain
MITERILKLIELKGITKYKFCKDLGLSNGFLDKPREISTDKYANILEYFPDINPKWLLTGFGEMLKNISATIPAEETHPNEIYLYDVSAAAGYGSFDEIISKEKIVGKFIIPTFQDISWMIYVRGSSMYPKYSSGDVIACRVLFESKFIQWGKVYVVATQEQGLLVKRLKQSNNENFITAVSDNKMYDPFEIPKDEILGIALVVGVIRLE